MTIVGGQVLPIFFLENWFSLDGFFPPVNNTQVQARFSLDPGSIHHPMKVIQVQWQEFMMYFFHWWLNQPIWKNMLVKLDHELPRIVVTKKIFEITTYIDLDHVHPGWTSKRLEVPKKTWRTPWMHKSNVTSPKKAWFLVNIPNTFW